MTPPAGHPIISPSGIPSAVMVFRILHPNLWVANYYSARNPLRLSSLVILGVVARAFFEKL